MEIKKNKKKKKRVKTTIVKKPIMSLYLPAPQTSDLNLPPYESRAFQKYIHLTCSYYSQGCTNACQPEGGGERHKGTRALDFAELNGKYDQGEELKICVQGSRLMDLHEVYDQEEIWDIFDMSEVLRVENCVYFCLFG